jgi:hypothetical protein
LLEKSEEMVRANEYISQVNLEVSRVKEFLRQRDSELERVICGKNFGFVKKNQATMT